ncbi:response regulator transcription factor [Streptomyces sp. ZAF1911]|uniref:response regulator transcription factor n=1 Tax=Streptomyces sp. ZAF1911 TaxID=2944129 RepID=UPI00237A8AEF|nr:response regulator transcription factor [Streptomyces sp. ZAF1911]MDD9376136.1 response regulator transcription factor [Streptomyces sp. ZAF1911]
MIRIVITDDEDVIRAGLRTILAVPDEIEVVGEASSGSEALQVVAAHSPDVVLLDLAMPDGPDGAETARLLREEHPGLGILVLTTIADEEQVARVWRAGADGYLLKTASGAEMREAVHSAAGHRAVLSPDVISTVMSRFATHHHPAPTPEVLARVHSLSQGELRCVVALADGLGNREIAERLGLAEGTVKTHLSRALHKCGLDNRTQLALLANDQRELLTGLLH